MSFWFASLKNSFEVLFVTVIILPRDAIGQDKMKMNADFLDLLISPSGFTFTKVY